MKAEWSNKDSLEMPTTTMSDYIKREDAIKEAKAWSMYGKEDLITRLGRLPSIEIDDWTPVSEGLPEDDKEVLVTVHFLGLDMKSPTGWIDHIKPSTYVETARHMDGEWCSDSDEYKVACNRHRVIAWKPLPEPYEEQEDE